MGIKTHCGDIYEGKMIRSENVLLLWIERLPVLHFRGDANEEKQRLGPPPVENAN